MRSLGVVVFPPLFDQDLGLPEGIEYLPVEQLVAEAGIEALDNPLKLFRSDSGSKLKPRNLLRLRGFVLADAPHRSSALLRAQPIHEPEGCGKVSSSSPSIVQSPTNRPFGGLSVPTITITKLASLWCDLRNMS